MAKILCGNEMDKMPGWAFRIMATMFNIQDFFIPAGSKLDPFSIQKGFTVIDWGSGTGRYLKKASWLTGENGKVYAVDIHELAVESAHKQVRKHGLTNVVPALTDGISVDIPAHCADVVYALDMFHMVRNTFVFLKELNRVTKDDGVLYLEDGHQPRSVTKEKILKSGFWKIIEERKNHVVCKPVKQSGG